MTRDLKAVAEKYLADLEEWNRTRALAMRQCERWAEVWAAAGREAPPARVKIPSEPSFPSELRCSECHGDGEVECGECGGKKKCTDCAGVGIASEARKAGVKL